MLICFYYLAFVPEKEIEPSKWSRAQDHDKPRFRMSKDTKDAKEENRE